MLLQLSRIVLERELCRRLAPIGAFAEVEAQMEQFPAERFSLFVSAKPVLPAGLPAAVRPASSAQALEAIRQSTEYLRAGRLTDEEFCQCRTLLEKQAEGWLAKPENLVTAILDRNSKGLDMASGYRSRIRSLRRGQLDELLLLLGEGRRIEYVVL